MRSSEIALVSSGKVEDKFHLKMAEEEFGLRAVYCITILVAMVFVGGTVMGKIPLSSANRNSSDEFNYHSISEYDPHQNPKRVQGNYLISENHNDIQDEWNDKNNRTGVPLNVHNTDTVNGDDTDQVEANNTVEYVKSNKTKSELLDIIRTNGIVSSNGGVLKDPRNEIHLQMTQNNTNSMDDSNIRIKNVTIQEKPDTPNAIAYETQSSINKDSSMYKDISRSSPDILLTNRGTLATPDPEPSNQHRRHRVNLGESGSGTLPPYYDGKIRVKIPCHTKSQDALMRWLGPAFNARYMSVTSPKLNGARDTSTVLTNSDDFYVNKDFKHDMTSLDEKSVRALNSSDSVLHRQKRLVGPDLQWKCDEKLIWEDLGADHYPRYVRKVACVQQACFYGMYRCREKAFTVKILRRLSEKCVPIYEVRGKGPGARPRSGSRPTAYVQEWVFEERALPFCCECGRS